MTDPRRLRPSLLAGLLLGWPGLAADAGGETLRGRVQLLVRGGGRPAPAGEVANALVWFEGDGQSAAAAAAGPYEVTTRNKRFEPRLLAVPRGATVRFPNLDPILHNVFSVSRGNAFDLGLLGQGPGGEAIFAEAGVARIFCNVHHEMFAHVLVLDTPHVATPGPQGRFVFDGLPSGRGSLTVWHERAEPTVVALTLPAAAPVELELTLTKPRIPRHFNKLGRRYGRARDERY